MPAPLWQPRSNLSARLLGLGCAGAGAAVLYWQIVVTLRLAAENNPDITYSLKLIALGEMFVVIGLIWMVSGLAGYGRILGLQKDRRFLFALVLVSIFAVFATDHFMTRELARYGYGV